MLFIITINIFITIDIVFLLSILNKYNTKYKYFYSIENNIYLLIVMLFIITIDIDIDIDIVFLLSIENIKQ